MTIVAVVAWQYGIARQRRAALLEAMSYVRASIVPGSNGAGEEIIAF